MGNWRYFTPMSGVVGPNLYLVEAHLVDIHYHLVLYNRPNIRRIVSFGVPLFEMQIDIETLELLSNGEINPHKVFAVESLISTSVDL